jgi:hypothetical protein
VLVRCSSLLKSNPADTFWKVEPEEESQYKEELSLYRTELSSYNANDSSSSDKFYKVDPVSFSTEFELMSCF